MAAGGERGELVLQRQIQDGGMAVSCAVQVLSERAEGDLGKGGAVEALTRLDRESLKQSHCRIGKAPHGFNDVTLLT